MPIFFFFSKVFEHFKDQNYRVSYFRIPISPEQAPEDNYFDEYVRVIKSLKPTDPLILVVDRPSRRGGPPALPLPYHPLVLYLSECLLFHSIPFSHSVHHCSTVVGEYHSCSTIDPSISWTVSVGRSRRGHASTRAQCLPICGRTKPMKPTVSSPSFHSERTSASFECG